MIAWLLAASAAAHPFDAAFYGHKLGVYVGDTTVDVTYVVEVPTVDLLDRIRGWEARGRPRDGFDASMRAELANGLLLRVDGATTPMTVTSVASEAVSARFVEYRFALTAPLPAGDEHTIELQNGNTPDTMAYFLNEVRFAPLWSVEACSTIVIEDGRVTASRDGKWRMEEANRVVRARVRRADRLVDRLARVLVPGGDAPRTPTEAAVIAPTAALLDVRPRGEAVLAGLIGALVAGVTAPGRLAEPWWGRLAPPIVAVAAAAAIAAMFATPAMAGAVAAAFAGGAGAGLVGRRRVPRGLGVGALLAAAAIGAWVAARTP